MKKKIILSACCLLIYCLSFSQQKDYRVVFDLTSKDTLAHQTAVRQMGLIARSNPDAKVELVLFGQSVPMVLTEKSVVKEELAKLLQLKNVSVNVCEVTLQRMKVDKSQLLPGVGTVPDGIYEIITRQREGWGYIKIAQ